MEFSSPDDGLCGEYSGAGFVEISQIFVMQDSFSFGRTSFSPKNSCKHLEHNLAEEECVLLKPVIGSATAFHHICHIVDTFQMKTSCIDRSPSMKDYRFSSRTGNSKIGFESEGALPWKKRFIVFFPYFESQTSCRVKVKIFLCCNGKA